jgi:hypothetical protein
MEQARQDDHESPKCRCPKVQIVGHKPPQYDLTFKHNELVAVFLPRYHHHCQCRIDGELWSDFLDDLITDNGNIFAR